MAMALRHRASQAQFLFCNLHRASTLPALSRSRSYYTDRDTLEPFHPIPGREPKICSSQEAVQVIESGNRVFIHSAAQCPRELVSSMIERGRRKEIHGVHVCHIHTEGPAEYAHAEFKGIFQANTFFTGANIRKDVQSGNADFTPIFLREIPLLFRSEALPVDVALISCSPPDKHGYCSLGVSVDVTRAALQSARVVIAQINRHVPRTFGDGFIHLSHFNYVVNQDEPLPESACPGETEADNMIGKHIAENLITDGACLQMGIGRIPDAVLSRLCDHKNLGIHTEMLSDGVLNLVKKGAVTNAKKAIHPGSVVTSFAVGSRRLYDFLDDNPFTRFLDTAYVNNPTVIGKNDNVTAINSIIEIDLTGQVVASTIGTKVYSGIGGQLDFQLGARYSKGGKAIIAFPSKTSKGESRIVPFLKSGAAVTTSREHVDWVVTEHGICNLFGKTLRQRAKALIEIADPIHRESLLIAAREKLGIHL